MPGSLPSKKYSALTIVVAGDGSVKVKDRVVAIDSLVVTGAITTLVATGPLVSTKKLVDVVEVLPAVS